MKRVKIAAGLMTTGCICFCVTLPLSNILNNVAIGLIILAWLWEGAIPAKLRSLPGSVVILPIGFYLLHVTGLIYTDDFIEAGKHLETKAAILLLPLCLGTTRLLTLATVRTIMRTFVLANLSVVIFCFGYAFFRFHQTGDTEVFYYHHLTEVLDLHAIYFAMYLSFSILIILYFHYFQGPLFSNVFSIFLLTAFLVTIAFLAAVTVLFILPILILRILMNRFLLTYSLTRRVLVLAAALVVFFLVVYALPYTRNKLQRIAQTEYSMDLTEYKWTSLTIRLAKWKCASDVLKDHWIAGVGTGDGQNAMMESYRINGFAEGLKHNYNTHNQYLETWIMLGIPGLVCLIWMLWPLRGNILWICFIVLIAFSFLTENVLDTQKGVVFFSFFYALLPHLPKVLSADPAPTE